MIEPCGAKPQIQGMKTPPPVIVVAIGTLAMIFNTNCYTAWGSTGDAPQMGKVTPVSLANASGLALNLQLPAVKTLEPGHSVAGIPWLIAEPGAEGLWTRPHFG